MPAETRFGAVLVEMEIVTQSQLDAALDKQAESPPGTRLGDVLLAQGVVSPQDVDTVLQVQKDLRKGRTLQAHILIQRHQVGRLERSVSRQMDLTNRALGALAR